MIVVYSDAVHGQGAMMIIADAASIAYTAVVHSRKLEDLALLAIAPLTATRGHIQVPVKHLLLRSQLDAAMFFKHLKFPEL